VIQVFFQNPVARPRRKIPQCNEFGREGSLWHWLNLLNEAQDRSNKGAIIVGAVEQSSRHLRPHLRPLFILLQTRVPQRTRGLLGMNTPRGEED